MDIKKIFLIILFCTPLVVFSQKNITADSNLIFWGAGRVLSVQDFNIVTSNTVGNYSYGQFSYDYKNIITTFGFGLAKDYKKKIRNYFIKSASWIDTTYDVQASLRYQQTGWNLTEVYVRKLRKSIYEKRKHLKTQQAYDDINIEIITALAKRRVEYDTGTAFGTITEKQKEWEAAISYDLEGLKDYSAE